MPQPPRSDLYAPLAPSRKVPINFNPDKGEVPGKESPSTPTSGSPLLEMRQAIPGDRATDSGHKHKTKSFKPQEIRGVGVQGRGHSGGLSGSDLSDSNTGSPMSTIDSGLNSMSGVHSPGQSRYGLDNVHKSRSTDKQLHNQVIMPEGEGPKNRSKESVNGHNSTSAAIAESLYENIPARKSGNKQRSPRDPNKHQRKGKSQRSYEYSSDEESMRQEYRENPPRSKFQHSGPKQPIPTPRNRPTRPKEAERQPNSMSQAAKQKQSPRSQRIPQLSSQDSDITFVDPERNSEIELKLITKGSVSPVEAQPRSSQGKPRRSSEGRQRKQGGSHHSSKSSLDELESHKQFDKQYPPAIGDESHFPAHLSSIEEGGYHRNGTVTMTGTIKRGKGVNVNGNETVEVQYTLSRRELKSLNRSAKLEQDKTKGGCICGLKKGPHIFIWSLIFMPFAFLASLFWSFYIGSLTWYNIFLYLSEEKAWYHRVFICPWLIVLYPVLIVLMCISIAIVGMFKQISWFLSSWYKEIRDPEKGFFGALCEKMGLGELAPYEVVVLDENPVAQTAGQGQTPTAAV